MSLPQFRERLCGSLVHGESIGRVIVDESGANFI